ncbi:MAG: carboxypeptidase-like regulatory domain-containing protein [candidate division WOR-3 bacterium]
MSAKVTNHDGCARKSGCSRPTVYVGMLLLGVLSLCFHGFSSFVGDHQPGEDCFKCHSEFQVAGTVFSDATGKQTQPGVPVSLIKEDGGEIVLGATNANGNIASSSVPNGRYLMRVSALTSRTWHAIPGQGSCNTCHIVGGNGSSVRTKAFPPYHTRIPSDNDCAHCHHFPASMSLAQLKTLGVLNAASQPPPLPGSQVEIAGRVFSFNPADYNITTVRPDIFAPGYFSMFDVILAVAERNGIPLTYHYDESCKTHFITSINGAKDDYWYHFSYDAGSGNAAELNNRRANRWDEALWRPGVWIKVVRGENVAELKREYQEEIRREETYGHIIPSVRISLNPSSYRGNPPESGRISVSRDYSNVQVTAHNLRATGYPSPYSKPFQPGVVTSLDILLSLKDQGKLDVVTPVFYTHFAQHYIDSYYVVALGFPGIGVAHASGRHGFVYITENGTFDQLPNNAARTFHITCDISVLHAPDFSYWRWAELGNPYYESAEPNEQMGRSLKYRP